MCGEGLVRFRDCFVGEGKGGEGLFACENAGGFYVGDFCGAAHGVGFCAIGNCVECFDFCQLHIFNFVFGD